MRRSIAISARTAKLLFQVPKGIIQHRNTRLFEWELHTLFIDPTMLGGPVRPETASFTNNRMGICAEFEEFVAPRKAHQDPQAWHEAGLTDGRRRGCSLGEHKHNVGTSVSDWVWGEIESVRHIRLAPGFRVQFYGFHRAGPSALSYSPQTAVLLELSMVAVGPIGDGQGSTSIPGPHFPVLPFGPQWTPQIRLVVDGSKPATRRREPFATECDTELSGIIGHSVLENSRASCETEGQSFFSMS